MNMEKKRIIINGSGGTGKDSFVKFCSERILTMNIDSVHNVKRALQIMGWDGNIKDEKTRLALCELKKISIAYNNNPYEYVKSKLDYFENSIYQLAFIHIREPEEIEIVKNDFNCKTLLFDTNRVEKINSNTSDKNVHDYEYDIIICNNEDLEHLKQSAYAFVDGLFCI